jgi:hypothetical protein
MVAKFMVEGSKEDLEYTTTLQGDESDQKPPPGASVDATTIGKNDHDDEAADSPPEENDKATVLGDEASPHGAAAQETDDPPFVFVVRRGAKVHTVSPFFPKLALCGWQFNRCERAVISDTTEPMRVFGDVQLCLKCVRAQHDADSDSDGELSSSSSES